MHISMFPMIWQGWHVDNS